MSRFAQFAGCMLVAASVWQSGHGLCRPVIRQAKLISVCPVGWTPFTTSCYLFTMCTSWFNCTADVSVQRCAVAGGHLASVKSADENDFIGAMVAADVTHILLGGRDDVIEGNWRWADGEAFGYTNWDVAWGEPNDFGAGEDCMEMYHSPTNIWNDIGCGDMYYPVISGYMCRRQPGVMFV